MTRNLDEISRSVFGDIIFSRFAADEPSQDERIANFRKELEAHDYTESRICALLRVPNIARIGAAAHRTLPSHLRRSSPLKSLIQLFLFDGPIDESMLSGIFSRKSIALLIELGIILRIGDKWRSQVHLHPHGAFLVATDTSSTSNLWPADSPLSDRVMFLAQDSIGLGYVTPQTPSRRTLDLCTGSGIQALLASRYSDKVVGVDLNPRAVRFARFNASLNGILNVNFVKGDLFTPVVGRKFDLIIANPPFVPTPGESPSLLYRDGGPKGDSVLKRIVEEGWHHLAENGRMVITTDLANLNGIRERIGEWVGQEASQVDALVLVEGDIPLDKYAKAHASHMPDRRRRLMMARELVAHYRRERIRTIHSAYIVLARAPRGFNGIYEVVQAAGPITRPIGKHVLDHFAHLDLWRRGVPDGVFLELAPRVRLIAPSTMGAKSANRHFRLTAPGDDFIPDMEMGPGVYTLLQRIRRGSCRWSDVANTRTKPLLRRMVAQGVVCFQKISH